MKKYYTLIAAAAAMALAFGSCTEEDPVPPLPTDFEEDVIAGEDDTDEPDEEEPGGTPAAPDEEGNFIHDSGFGEATLANALYSETLVYNEWLYYVAGTHTGKFTLEITDDAERGRVGKMTNAGTAIPNSDPGRSFFCQQRPRQELLLPDDRRNDGPRALHHIFQGKGGFRTCKNENFHTHH